MKHKFTVCLSLFILSLASYSKPALEIIPPDGWMNQWEYSRDAKSYQGDDLFFLINGGADLFLEYGFVDVAAVELSHPDDGKIYCEVYRMDSDSAAFGIFSVRRGKNPPLKENYIWTAAGDDFLHIWQGNYYISVSAADTRNEKRMHVFGDLLQHFKKAIPESNQLPVFAKQYKMPGKAFMTYIMGPLALNNIYNFGYSDIFHVKEAIVIEDDESKKLVFHYPDNKKAQEIYQSVAQHMKSGEKYSNFISEENSFHITDRQERKIAVGVNNKVIEVMIAE